MVAICPVMGSGAESRVAGWRSADGSESGRVGERSLAVPAKRRFSAARLVPESCQTYAKNNCRLWQLQKRLTGTPTLRRQCLHQIPGTAVALASELITANPSASSLPACRSNRTLRDIAPSSFFANRFCLNFQNLLLSVNSGWKTTYECGNAPRRQRAGFRGRHW